MLEVERRSPLGRGSKVDLRRSRVEGRSSKVAGRRSIVEGRSSRVAAPALLLLALGGRALAEPHPAPLRSFPAARLEALGPMLRSQDVVVVETGEHGALKQLTALTLAAAPPEVVRDVVIHPERYGEFVRNMSVS